MHAGVPARDDRNVQFALQHNLPVVKVLDSCIMTNSYQVYIIIYPVSTFGWSDTFHYV